MIFITGTLSCVYPIAVFVEHFALVVSDVHYSIHSEDTCADILISRIYRSESHRNIAHFYGELIKLQILYHFYRTNPACSSYTHKAVVVGIGLISPEHTAGLLLYVIIFLYACTHIPEIRGSVQRIPSDIQALSRYRQPAVNDRIP